MKAVLTGYFKFSPVKTSEVRFPAGELGRLLVESAAGAERWAGSAHGFICACVGRCGELGWYRNGGWLPRGGGSNRCAAKARGDILGVCASLETGDSVWLYLDKDFETGVSRDFFEKEERWPVRKIVRMKGLPGQEWLDAFCRRTHDPAAFEKVWLGRTLTYDEKKKVSDDVKATGTPEWAGLIDTFLGI